MCPFRRPSSLLFPFKSTRFNPHELAVRCGNIHDGGGCCGSGSYSRVREGKRPVEPREDNRRQGQIWQKTDTFWTIFRAKLHISVCILK